MATTRKICPNGHYYDGSRYTECPYCKPGAAASGMSVTVPADAPAAPAASATPLGATMPAPAAADEGKTMPLHMGKASVRPVVGWLVCVEGPDCGRDYRLHADNNFVGRSSEMDVSIRNDQSVSNVNHFSVSYDTRHDRFFIAAGTGQAIVYLNDTPVTTAASDLKKGDRIEVGTTTLVFVPLCGPDFHWEDEK